MLIGSAFYSKYNEDLIQYPGLKMLAFYHQFKGVSNRLDIILLLSARDMKLPESDDMALEMAMQLHETMDCRYQGKPV
jgi:hypothetical protein